MKEQTAVDWLVDALILNQDNPHYNQWAINKAKEMEKEQNHAEYMRGWKDGLTKQQEQIN